MEHSLTRNFSSFFFLLLLANAIGVISCKDENRHSPENKQEKKIKKETVKKEVIPPVFNADSAYQFIAFQEQLGPRVPGTPAHKNFLAWASDKLKSYGARVQIQKAPVTTHDHKGFTINNLIAVFYPERKERILLCTHYDSRPVCEKEKDPLLKNKPCPGINDGGSGVGVLLEMSRHFIKQDPGIGVDIIFFDLEDAGDNQGAPETWCLGSQYWAKNLHVSGYAPRYGILLDMVGHPAATFPKEGYSMFYAPDVVEKIWKIAGEKGFSKYFINEEGPELTDDHLFINQIAKIPCVDIIDYKINKLSFFEHHHTQEDVLKHIDKNTLYAIGTTLLYVIYNER